MTIILSAAATCCFIVGERCNVCIGVCRRSSAHFVYFTRVCLLVIGWCTFRVVKVAEVFAIYRYTCSHG